MANPGAVVATRNMRPYIDDYDAANDLPASTVEFGGNWAGTWKGPYYTDGGLTVDLAIDRANVGVDQEIWDLLRPITGGSATFGTNLAELEMENVFRATGVGELDTTAPGPTDLGHDDFIITSAFTQNFVTFAFEAEQQNGLPVRAIVYKGIPTGTPSIQFGVADQKAMTAFSVDGIPGDEDADHPVILFRKYLPTTGA